MLQMENLVSTQDVKFDVRQTPIQLSGNCRIKGNFEVEGNLLVDSMSFQVDGNFTIGGNVTVGPWKNLYAIILAKKIFIDGDVNIPLFTLQADEIEITGTCTCCTIKAKRFKCSQYSVRSLQADIIES